MGAPGVAMAPGNYIFLAITVALLGIIAHGAYTMSSKASPWWHNMWFLSMASLGASLAFASAYETSFMDLSFDYGDNIDNFNIVILNTLIPMVAALGMSFNLYLAYHGKRPVQMDPKLTRHYNAATALSVTSMVVSFWAAYTDSS